MNAAIAQTSSLAPTSRRSMASCATSWSRALQRVPELAGRELVLTPLSGGITNRNFRVDADGGLAAPAAAA